MAHQWFYHPAVLYIFESQHILKTERKMLRFLISKFEKFFLGSEFNSYLARLFLPVSTYASEAKCKIRL